GGRVRIIVVLPDPFGPSKPTAPAGTETERSLRATTAPYVLVTPSSWKSMSSPEGKRPGGRWLFAALRVFLRTAEAGRDPGGASAATPQLTPAADCDFRFTGEVIRPGQSARAVRRTRRRTSSRSPGRP